MPKPGALYHVASPFLGMKNCPSPTLTIFEITVRCGYRDANGGIPKTKSLYCKTGNFSGGYFKNKK